MGGPTTDLNMVRVDLGQHENAKIEGEIKTLKTLIVFEVLYLTMFVAVTYMAKISEGHDLKSLTKLGNVLIVSLVGLAASGHHLHQIRTWRSHLKYGLNVQKFRAREMRRSVGKVFPGEMANGDSDQEKPKSALEQEKDMRTQKKEVLLEFEVKQLEMRKSRAKVFAFQGAIEDAGILASTLLRGYYSFDENTCSVDGIAGLQRALLSTQVFVAIVAFAFRSSFFRDIFVLKGYIALRMQQLKVMQALSKSQLDRYKNLAYREINLVVDIKSIIGQKSIAKTTDLQILRFVRMTNGNRFKTANLLQKWLQNQEPMKMEEMYRKILQNDMCLDNCEPFAKLQSKIPMIWPFEFDLKHNKFVGYCYFDENCVAMEEVCNLLAPGELKQAVKFLIAWLNLLISHESEKLRAVFNVAILVHMEVVPSGARQFLEMLAKALHSISIIPFETEFIIWTGPKKEKNDAVMDYIEIVDKMHACLPCSVHFINNMKELQKHISPILLPPYLDGSMTFSPDLLPLPSDPWGIIGYNFQPISVYMGSEFSPIAFFEGVKINDLKAVPRLKRYLLRLEAKSRADVQTSHPGVREVLKATVEDRLSSSSRMTKEETYVFNQKLMTFVVHNKEWKFPGLVNLASEIWSDIFLLKCWWHRKDVTDAAGFFLRILIFRLRHNLEQVNKKIKASDAAIVDNEHAKKLMRVFRWNPVAVFEPKRQILNIQSAFPDQRDLKQLISWRDEDLTEAYLWTLEYQQIVADFLSQRFNRLIQYRYVSATNPYATWFQQHQALVSKMTEWKRNYPFIESRPGHLLIESGPLGSALEAISFILKGLGIATGLKYLRVMSLSNLSSCQHILEQYLDLNSLPRALAGTNESVELDEFVVQNTGLPLTRLVSLFAGDKPLELQKESLGKKHSSLMGSMSEGRLEDEGSSIQLNSSIPVQSKVRCDPLNDVTVPRPKPCDTTTCAKKTNAMFEK